MRVSLSTLKRTIAKGELATVRVGKHRKVPASYLAAYVASRTNVKVHTWQGACEVHERFTAADVKKFKISGSNVVVMARRTDGELGVRFVD